MLVKELRAFQAGQPGAAPQPVAPSQSATVGTIGTGESVGSVFRRFDADSSGSIDVVELREALNALGLPSDTAGAAEVLTRYDKDGSGRLELPEFRLLVKELKAFQGQ